MVQWPQRRISAALEADVESDTIRQYENVLGFLDSVKEESITDEGEQGEDLRRKLIYQDFLNRGYSKERAEREVKKSFDSGSDIEDAKDALEIIEKMPKSKFDETVELHVKLGVDSKHADQQVRGTVVLPNGTGKSKKVLVLAKSEKAAAAEAAGADYVGDDDMIAKIANEGWLDFDAVVATPDMMPALGRIAKILGPKGLMPNPKAGTVTVDTAKAVSDIKAGKVEYRLDKNNIIHASIGKVSFGSQKIKENYETLLEAIVKAKPAAAKGTYLKSIALSTTMGPGIKITTKI